MEVETLVTVKFLVADEVAHGFMRTGFEYADGARGMTPPRFVS